MKPQKWLKASVKEETNMSELAKNILQVLARYQIGQVLAEGRVYYEYKQVHGQDICTPHQFSIALYELAQKGFLEQKPVLPDWQIFHLPSHPERQ